MPINILMPALSPTMTEGNLAKWHKKEGDPIRSGDVLCEIESDKAILEYESIDDGTMGRIVVPEGTEGIAINEVIGVILEEGEDASALDAAPVSPAAVMPPPPEAVVSDKPPEAATENKPPEAVVSDQPPVVPIAAAATTATAEVSASPLARRIARQAGMDIAALSGSGGHGRVMRADVEAALAGAALAAGPATAEGTPAQAANGGPAPAQPGNGGPGPARTGNGGPGPARTGNGERARLFASPLARRMAGQAGLDLAAIAGSGPNGRIVKSDIDAAMAAPQMTQAVTAATPAAAQPPAGETSTVVALGTMRKVIAQRMTESKTTVPHFYLTVDCEIDELLRVRSELNARQDSVKISVNDFIIRACALALIEVPAANVSFEGVGRMRQYTTADISVAVAIEGGLITPIVRAAETKGLARISAEMKDLAARARDGKLAPADYQGGSFSISNLGMFGVKQFDAVINPPQACILAVGAGEKRPVVRGDAVVPATVMSCTLSVDHRVVDGAIGARLLAAIKRLIEYPPAMLL